MVYRIPEAKPNLKGGGSVDASEQKPSLAYDASSEIIMFSEESWFSIIFGWMKTSLLFAASTIFLFTVMVLVSSASLLFFAPVDGKVEVVARDTFLGGVPSAGDVVLASPTQVAKDNPLERLQEAIMGIDEAKIYTVLSEDVGTVDISGGQITVTGKETVTVTGELRSISGNPIVESFTLKNQHLAECVSESCTPGSYVILDGDKIFGEVIEVEGMLR